MKRSFGTARKTFASPRSPTQGRRPDRRHRQITATAICGSDLPLYDGYQPGMESGDILGHEPMGIVVERAPL